MNVVLETEKTASCHSSAQFPRHCHQPLTCFHSSITLTCINTPSPLHIYPCSSVLFATLFSFTPETLSCLFLPTCRDLDFHLLDYYFPERVSVQPCWPPDLFLICLFACLACCSRQFCLLLSDFIFNKSWTMIPSLTPSFSASGFKLSFYISDHNLSVPNVLKSYTCKN